MKKKPMKVVFSGMAKEQIKKLPKEVKKSFDKAIEKIKENPYCGKPADEEDAILVIVEYLKHNYDLTEDERISIFCSNGLLEDLFSKVVEAMKK